VRCQASGAFTSKRPDMSPPYNVVITGSTKGAPCGSPVFIRTEPQYCRSSMQAWAALLPRAFCGRATKWWCARGLVSNDGLSLEHNMRV
jgi:hypothetical protein